MNQPTRKATRHTSAHRRPGRALRAGVTATVAMVVLAGGILGWRAMTARSDGAAQPTLDVCVVSPTSFDITTTSSGELEAKNQIKVRSELENNSTIVEVVDEGKAVHKGDVLIRLNSDQIQTQITDVSLRVESAKAELEKAETACKIQEKDNASQLSQARLKVTLAELAYKQWDEGEKLQKTRDNEQAIEKATQEKERLGEKYDKCVELQKKGYVSTDQMKQDKLEYEDACRALDKANLAKDIFEKYEIPKDRASKQSDVDQAKEALDRVEEQTKIELRSKEAAKITAQRTLDMHQENLAKLQHQLEKSTIVAPADGLVVYATSMERSRWGGDDGPLQVGRQVFPNQDLIYLPDTSEMVASVRVHETLASRIKEGLPATVKVDAVGGRVFSAKVLSIGILAEASGWRDPNLREYTVKLAITNAEGVELKPSMRCEAEITMGHVDDTLAIPIQAVQNDGAMRFVYVQTAGAAYVRRPVKLGRTSESLAEVTGGLAAGERVLLREPSPSEVIDRPIPDSELTVAGLKRDDKGQIVMVGGRPGPGGKAGRGGGHPGRSPKDAQRGDGVASKATDKETKPEAAVPKEPEAAKPETTETISKGSVATPPAPSAPNG